MNRKYFYSEYTAKYSIRYLVINGNYLFFTADIAAAMGLKETSKLLKRLGENEITKHSINNNGKTELVKVVNEYCIVEISSRAKKDTIRNFYKWFKCELIPSLRSGVVRSSDNKQNEVVNSSCTMSNADNSVKLMSAFTNCRRKPIIISDRNGFIEWYESLDVEVKKAIIDQTVKIESLYVEDKDEVGNKINERWKSIYEDFDYKYNLNLKKKYYKYKTTRGNSQKSKLYYVITELSMITELFLIVCEMYEMDLKNVLKTKYNITIDADLNEIINEIYEEVAEQEDE